LPPCNWPGALPLDIGESSALRPSLQTRAPYLSCVSTPHFWPGLSPPSPDEVGAYREERYVKMDLRQWRRWWISEICWSAGRWSVQSCSGRVQTVQPGQTYIYTSMYTNTR